MRAVVMREFGAPSVLAVDDAADPTPGPGEALVRVAAVEVSPVRDAATRSGKHPFSQAVTLPHILGGDFSGTVEAVGEGVDPAWVGRRVAGINEVACGHCPNCLAGFDESCDSLNMMGVHRNGTYAELATTPISTLHRIPEEMSFEEAAAFASDGPIAYVQLEKGEVTEGTWLLVPGAAGGLGSTLVSMAASRGANVIAMSRRDPAMLERWGATATVSGSDENLAERLLEITGGHGVDVAIDNIALAGPFEQYMQALAVRGRVIMSGAVSHAPLSFSGLPFYLKSQSIIGVRTGNTANTAGFWVEFANGLRIPEETYGSLPLSQAAAAHELMASGDKVGHLVLVNDLG